MDAVGFIQTSNTRFYNGCCDELIYSDPNFTSTSPYYYDDESPRVQTSEKSYTEILNELGSGIWNFFAEGLRVVGNLFVSTDSDENEVKLLQLQPNEQLKKNFSSQLISVSSIQHTEGKKLTAHLYSREQLISAFTQIKKDLKKSINLNYLSDEFRMILSALKVRRTAKHLSIEEKAIISKSFNELVAYLETKKEGLTGRDKFVATIIDDWNDTFDYWSRESLAEKIKVELEKGKQTKLGQISSKSSRLSFGGATPFSDFGTSIEVGLKGSHDRINLVDAERYRNKYDLHIGGVYGETDFGVKIPEKENVKSQIKGTADVQLMFGTFQEPKTAMDEVTHNFNKLIMKEKHRNNPNIAPFFSRDRLLNLELGSDNEVKDIEQVRHNYNAKKEGIDKRLSLYMSSSLPSELTKPTDKPKWASNPVKVASGKITEATVFGAVGKAIFGAEAKAEAKIDLLNNNSDDDNDQKLEDNKNCGITAGIGAHLSAYGSVELMARNRSEVKHTLIGQIYVSATKSDEVKESIKQQVKTQFKEVKKGLLNTLQNEVNSFKHKYTTELGFDVLNWAKATQTPDRKQYISEELYLEALQKNEKDIIEFLEFLKINNLDSKLVELRNKTDADRRNCLFELGNSRLTISNRNIDFNVTTKDALKLHIAVLKQALEKYTALHNGKVGLGQEFQTQAEKQKAIKEFEEDCGATSTEDWVHRMHVGSLYLLTNIEIEEPENDPFIDDLLQLEKTLSSPLFTVDKKYLEDRLYFLEDLNITLYQAQFEIETKAGAYAFLKIGGSDEEPENVNPTKEKSGLSVSAGAFAKFKCGMTYSYLSGHRNILRKGQGLQFSVTAGVGINVEAIIKAMTPDFNKHLPADIAQQALDSLKEKLLFEIEMAKSWTTEVTFDFYLGKPNQLSEHKNAKGFSFSHLTSRKLETNIADSTYKKTIGLSTYTAGFIPFDLTFGSGSINIKSEPVKEIYESNTMLQFATQYHHAYEDDVREIDKVTGVVTKDSYVHEFEKQLAPFFIKLAKESAVGAITLELNEFETAVNYNPNYIKQLLDNFQTARRASPDKNYFKDEIAAVRKAIKEGKTSNQLDGVLEEYNFFKVRKNLKEAAQDFKKNPTNKTRDHAVTCLRKLQHAFNPHFTECKINSPDLKPRPFVEVNPLAARFQENWARLSGMMAPYG
jgi:hypothetical protein